MDINLKSNDKKENKILTSLIILLTLFIAAIGMFKTYPFISKLAKDASYNYLENYDFAKILIESSYALDYKIKNQNSEEIKEQVRKEVQAGQSQREISRRYGISGYTVQSWCGLRPETKLRQAAPLRKGRPGKIKTIEDYEKENKRLKMENELLRDFLRSTERK